MHTDAAILTLAQWFSPAYPIGSFSYSHGLEWAVETQQVRCSRSLRDWLEDVLQFGAGQSDALFLAAAFKASDRAEIAWIDATCCAYAASKERLSETRQQGAAFGEITASIRGVNLDALAYPVAVGQAARLCALPIALTASMYLHAFCANLISAAMRLIPLGQTEGNRLIHQLAPMCQDIAGDSRDGDLSRLSSTGFLADIAAMKHETQYSRIFRT